MKYENPYYKKVKNSFVITISCNHCKYDVLKYQKVGKGGLIKLYIKRVIEGEVDLSINGKILICPKCNEALGIRLKLGSDEIYKMIRGQFNIKKNL